MTASGPSGPAGTGSQPSRGQAARGGRVPRPRQVVDYALARRAVLADVHAGRQSTSDVCDAHPYLLRAARFHGEPTERPCPVCRCSTPLSQVTYVYGDALGEASGRPRATRELPGLARAHADLHVYVVEVCGQCSWNHLVTSSVIGRVGAPAAKGSPRRPRGRAVES